MGARELGNGVSESAIRFDCQGVPLVGILHRPAAAKRRGLLMVVAGGPQFRVGASRQMILWARRMAREGYPVMRFDSRGMGDSYGEFRDFLKTDDDIRAAVDCFVAQCPDLDEVVLWGECNSASAILFYAFRDPRVKGLVLLNPWVRTDVVQARTVLRYYYFIRLAQPSFWRKLFSLQFNPLESLRSMIKLIVQARSGSLPSRGAPDGDGFAAELPHDLELPDRVLAGFSRFNGPMLMVLSGRDLIAREFDVLIANSPRWQAEIGRKALTRHDLAEGDHTFSSARLREQVVSWGIDWLGKW